MKAIPHAEWLAEVERRGKYDCKFVCPVCGNEASMNDWRALRPEPVKTMHRAPVECIGRIMPPSQRRAAFPLEAEPGAPERPCDYASFGLIGLCKTQVLLEGGGTVHVFEFAEVAGAD